MIDNEPQASHQVRQFQIAKEAEEEHEKRFVEQYKALESVLGDVEEVGLKALEAGADLGQTHERLQKAKGKRLFEWLQTLPIGSDLKKNVLEFARKAFVARKKGKQLGTNQLNLALCADENARQAPVQRVKRSTVCKWLRYANLTKVSLEQDLKERPIRTWPPEHAAMAIELLKPIVEASKGLEMIKKAQDQQGGKK